MKVTIFFKKKPVLKARLLSSSFSQAFGLMFQKPTPVLMDFKVERKPLDVHMFFCFWPLDLIFLDGKGTIIELKKSIKPFQLYSAKRAYYLLELPQGGITKYQFKVGLQLHFSKK